MDPKSRGEEPILARLRLAATLDVAENGDTGFRLTARSAICAPIR